MSSTVLDRARIRQAIDERRFSTLFEPTYSLQSGRVVGFEARTLISRSPVALESWLEAAQATGLGPELELAATRYALGSAAGLDDALWLGIHLSPTTMADPRTHDLFVSWSLPPLGFEDGRVAGRHPVLHLTTDLDHDPGSLTGQVTIGRAFTRDLTTSRRLRLRARRIITSAHRRGFDVVAEGVETPAQLRRWGQLGADAVRGLLLGAPSALPAVLASGAIAAQPPGRTRSASRGRWQPATCCQVGRARLASADVAN